MPEVFKQLSAWISFLKIYKYVKIKKSDLLPLVTLIILAISKHFKLRTLCILMN